LTYFIDFILLTLFVSDMATEQDEQLVQEIIGKVIDLAIEGYTYFCHIFIF